MSPSAKPAPDERELRERFKAARAPARAGYVLCPSCRVEVKADRLADHERAQHGAPRGSQA